MMHIKITRSQAYRLIPLALALLASGALQENAMTQTLTPRDTNTHHLFTPPSDRAVWDRRVKELREQIIVSAGLHPMPVKTPLNPQITGHSEGVDFTVDNVEIETVPGFYLCGNLYKPKGKKGPFPAIVNPHGHWAQGRLTREPDVQKADPAPAVPSPGKADLVAIGVNLARQGFVVFAYDMLGYVDTNQVSHTFAGNLSAWNHGISLMGFQLWNSIRAVDYVCSLKDVDSKRIGATGASGGGTQTFLLCAVDRRIKVAVPVNMVSADMQGGCLCENGPGLRVGTDNVEIAAMFAPKPMLLVAATGDWTKNVPTVEEPTIKSIYTLCGAENHVAVQQFNYEHNYNIESREAMYAWFGKWLQFDSNPGHYREQAVDLDLSHMRVWSSTHPRPANALDEPGLERYLRERSSTRLLTLLPKDMFGVSKLSKAIMPNVRHALAVDVPVLAQRTGNSVLVVGVEGDDRTDEVAKELKMSGRTVKTLILPIITIDTNQLWDGFYSCYNRVPLGDRVQAIVDELTRDGGTDMVGVGPAGMWALLARSLVKNGSVFVDMDGLDPTDDQALTERCYAPSLFSIADLSSIALVCAPTGVYLYNLKGDVWTTNLSNNLLRMSAHGIASVKPMETDSIIDVLRKN